jgi:hypothetical protein
MNERSLILSKCADDTQQITIHLPCRLAERADKYAIENGSTITNVVIEALDQFLRWRKEYRIVVDFYFCNTVFQPNREKKVVIFFKCAFHCVQLRRNFSHLNVHHFLFFSLFLLSWP